MVIDNFLDIESFREIQTILLSEEPPLALPRFFGCIDGPN